MDKVGPAPPSGQPSSLVPVKNSRAPGEARADTLGSWSGQSPVSRAGSLQLHCREQGYNGRAAAVCQPAGTGRMAQRPCLRGSSKSTLGGELSKTNPPPAKPSVRPRGREKKSQKRERDTHTHTHTHTPLHVPRAPAYMCTHTCTTDVAQRKQCTVQPSGAPGWSRARGKGGQEIPHPLGELGQVSPEGLGCSTEGCGGHRAPKSLSQGRGTWAQSHTPHTHTHKCMPPCALGAQMPYLVDCSPW